MIKIRDDARKILGFFIAFMAVSRDLTTEELAQAVDMPVTMLQMALKGIHELSIFEYLKLCVVLRLPLDSIATACGYQEVVTADDGLMNDDFWAHITPLATSATDTPAETTPRRGRGRPKKVNTAEETPVTTPRRRGRPRKNP